MHKKRSHLGNKLNYQWACKPVPSMTVLTADLLYKSRERSKCVISYLTLFLRGSNRVWTVLPLRCSLPFKTCVFILNTAILTRWNGRGRRILRAEQVLPRHLAATRTQQSADIGRINYLSTHQSTSGWCRRRRMLWRSARFTPRAGVTLGDVGKGHIQGAQHSSAAHLGFTPQSTGQRNQENQSLDISRNILNP